jgi:hypothetical protein
VRRLLILPTLLCLAACERVVDITVPDGPVQLVVEARLESVRGTPSGRQRVRLTTTAPYFRNAPTPAATGATVTVTDDAGRTTVLREAVGEPGSYLTDSLVAATNRSYTLRVLWEGDRYESTETLLPVAPIDSLYFRGPRANSPASAGLRATIDLRDPAGTTNYYLWDQFIDGVRQVASDTVFRFRVVDSDQFYNGRRVRGFQPYEAIRVSSGQQIIMRQLSISANAFRYYSALNDQVNGDGSPFSVPPASLRGNVVNLTRPDRRALGYFIASEVAEARGRVP